MGNGRADTARRVSRRVGTPTLIGGALALAAPYPLAMGHPVAAALTASAAVAVALIGNSPLDTEPSDR